MAEFIDNKENLILYGTVGTVKTHLATAIGVATCINGKRVAVHLRLKGKNHEIKVSILLFFSYFTSKYKPYYI